MPFNNVNSIIHNEYTVQHHDNTGVAWVNSVTTFLLTVTRLI